MVLLTSELAVLPLWGRLRNDLLNVVLDFSGREAGINEAILVVYGVGMRSGASKTSHVAGE